MSSGSGRFAWSALKARTSWSTCENRSMTSKIGLYINTICLTGYVVYTPESSSSCMSPLDDWKAFQFAHVPFRLSKSVIAGISARRSTYCRAKPPSTCHPIWQCRSLQIKSSASCSNQKVCSHTKRLDCLS